MMELQGQEGNGERERETNKRCIAGEDNESDKRGNQQEMQEEGLYRGMNVKE